MEGDRGAQGCGIYYTVMRSGAPKNSLLLLVFANTIALAGVLVWEWSIPALLVLYWAETGIIGLYQVIRLILGFRVVGFFLAIFFALHFGAFMFGHAVFIAALFFSSIDSAHPSDVALFWDQVDIVMPAIFALLVSHGYSFMFNGLYLGEYKEAGRKKMAEVFTSPYRRIVVMHLTIILGGFVVMVLGAPKIAAVAFIALKTFVDARAHIRLHTKNFSKTKEEKKETDGVVRKKQIKGPQYVNYSHSK